MNKRVLIFALLLTGAAFGQGNADTMFLTLDEVVQMARTQSLQSKVTQERYKNSYFSNRSFWRSFYPELSAQGTLPDLNRSLSRVTQNDGTDVFVERSQAVSDLQLNLSQKIAWTGGTVAVRTGLNRIDLFGDNSGTSYLSQPIGVTLIQPIFGFNNMKWDIRLQEVQEKQFEKRFDEDQEEVARNASQLFYELALATIMDRTSQQNKAYNDTIYQIAEGRYSMGKIAENELLQIELALLNSDMAQQQAALNLQIASLRLKNYLMLVTESVVMPVVDETIPPIQVNVDKAVQRAMETNSSRIQWELNQLQVQRNLANARADQRPNIDLFADYGLSRSAVDIDQAYVDPQDQQLLRVGFRIPIINWGRASSNYQAAVAEREMMDANYEMAMLEFEQTVRSQVGNFQLKYKQVELANRANEVATKRFFVSQQRFKIGKIGVTDLNIAIREKDVARQSFIQAIQSFWNSYYELRKLTHYDFLSNENIDYETPELR